MGELFKRRVGGVDANSQLESGIYQNASNCPSYYGMLIVFNSGGYLYKSLPLLRINIIFVVYLLLGGALGNNLAVKI